MGILFKCGIFGTKVAGMSYCCYYFQNIGVWGDSSRAYELYKNSIETLSKSPYYMLVTKTVESELPPQIRDLPSINDLNRCVLHYWNQGVISTFEVFGWIPSAISLYLDNSISYAVSKISPH